MKLCNFCDGGYMSTSLQIILTNKCPRNCSYCIAKEMRKRDCVKIDVDKIKDSVKTHMHENPGDHHIVITGGEPLLYKKECLEIADYIHSSLSNSVTLDTSLVPEDVNEILRHVDSYDLSFHDPVKTLEALKRIDSCLISKVRPVIVATNEYSHESMMQLLDDLYSLGIKRVKIAEVSGYENSSLYQNVLKLLKLNDDYDPFWSGCHLDVTLSQFPSLQVSLKLQCFRTTHKCYATWKDLYKTVWIKVARWLKHHFSSDSQKTVYSSPVNVIQPNGDLTHDY